MATDQDQAIRNLQEALERRAELRREGHAVLVAAINEARRAGLSLREIGSVLNISHAAVIKILNRDS